MYFKAIIPKLSTARFDTAPALRRWQGQVVRDMRTYPTQQPHVTYRRKGSGGYAGGWKMELTTDEASVSTDVPYAPFLGGNSPGDGEPYAVRWARPYGWVALRDVANKHLPELQQGLGTALTNGPLIFRG